jgi:hypothetical protein
MMVNIPKCIRKAGKAVVGAYEGFFDELSLELTGFTPSQIHESEKYAYGVADIAKVYEKHDLRKAAELYNKAADMLENGSIMPGVTPTHLRQSADMCKHKIDPEKYPNPYPGDQLIYSVKDFIVKHVKDSKLINPDKNERIIRM